MNWDIVLYWVIKIVGVFALFYGGLKGAGFVKKLIEKGMERAGLDVTLTRFAGNAVRWVIVILVALACLETFGIETTGFAALIGAAGLAIGLAFQGTLSSIAAGVLLLVLRPFKVGDIIRLNGITGLVTEIGLFATTLDTPDQRHIIMPNSTVVGTVIENMTHDDNRRVDVDVGADYSADLKQTREILQQVADAATPEGYENQVALTGLGACSVDWQVRVWAPQTDYAKVREIILEDVKVRLDAVGIGIPFPQMDVHLNSVDAA